VKPEPLLYGERRVYTVSAFNSGVASWLARLPTLWVEGEVTEFRRQLGWQSVFFTLKDLEDGACLPVSMPRGRFDALRLELADGMTVHVFGRPELFEARGVFRLRALSIEPLGLGALLAGIERLKHRLAAEGLFEPARKRPLPLFPRRVALLTGSDAAAKRDFVTAVSARFPAARVLVAETYVQGPQAASAIAATLERLAGEAEVDVVVLARGGGSFEDLLPFSDERVVRAVAASPVPVVSAVGHEQDTPLCDLAADARASTPTAAARLVVPDEDELRHRLETLHATLAREGRRAWDGARELLEADRARLVRAPTLLVERKRATVDGLAGRLRALSPKATLNRGYAIVRTDEGIVRAAGAVSPGEHVDVELAAGGFGATVDEVKNPSRNEALSRPAPAERRDSASSAAPVASGYERGSASLPRTAEPDPGDESSFRDGFAP
jgi:exodeoxyribonuclease VII large subunit